MSEQQAPLSSAVTWVDLTVPNAEAVCDFYSEVVGWKPEAVEVGDHTDFNMTMPAGDTPAAGICHALGENADLSPQWLIYITVADVDESVSRCLALGGAVVADPRDVGSGRFCVIRDRAGAVAALWSAGVE